MHDAVLGRIAARAPALTGLAQRHLGRLTPERWTIEWHLPWWLGHRSRLDPELVTALVRGNVLGMLAVRLEDDLVDGDIPEAEISSARRLAGIAFEEAVAEYRSAFAGNSPIWPFLDRSMADWRTGATGPNLAARAAPIKIAAYASCLAADRLDEWPALDACLEAAVRALVLYDQFLDWEADLDAGRWNAFVAAVVGDDQSPALRDRHRAGVLTAMLTGDVVRTHFDDVVEEATRAARLAVELGLPELAEFLTTWAARATAQGDELTDHYRTVAAQATRLLFGTRIGGAAA